MAESREYISRPDELGNINISEEVLSVIAAAAATEVEGVGGLAANLGSDIAELLGGKKNFSGASALPWRRRASGLISPSSSSTATPFGRSQEGADGGVCRRGEHQRLTVECVNVHVSGVSFDRTGDK